MDRAQTNWLYDLRNHWLARVVVGVLGRLFGWPYLLYLDIRWKYIEGKAAVILSFVGAVIVIAVLATGYLGFFNPDWWLRYVDEPAPVWWFWTAFGFYLAFGIVLAFFDNDDYEDY